VAHRFLFGSAMVAGADAVKATLHEFRCANPILLSEPHVDGTLSTR